jgi:hypothetical protein
VIKEYLKNILPATSIGIGVMNYKSIDLIREEDKFRGGKSLSLNKFFKHVTNEEEYKL